ncbi:MAG: segregation/condensation protein A [Patescibacteria group bacterium]|jgi:segregation and condensation protein A
MPKELKLEKFEGPLDLLLQLIENEKLAITDVSLSDVTDQFFQFLSGMDENRSDELADFLVIATRLVYIKSRQLLPYLYPPEEEGLSLSEQLKFYKRYADASKFVEKLWGEGKMAYGRVEPAPVLTGFTAPQNATAVELKNSFVLLLKRLKPINPLPEVRIDHTVSVQQKIKSIYESLKKLNQLSFKDIFNSDSNRSEVIVSFLALLELLKQEKISVNQKNSFNDMMINKV